jgi:uncharacterized protein (DUF1015 family)
MADVQPLRALHYDLDQAGPLDRLTAPPYDVIDASLRAELAARSPHNAVEIDLPEGEDRYAHAADLLEQWKSEQILVQDEEPALWALEQTYRMPDGSERVRSGFFCRVRITDYGPGLIRPHERTHPAAKQDRLQLMRATKANLSPIFALYPDPDGAARSALEPATAGTPWGEVTDDDGTTHRIWQVGDPEAIEAVQAALADRELLIADGHHRYETARTYAEEIGGEGEHRYVLMCLVSLSDPGLTILPTHRLVGGLNEGRRERLAELLEREFSSQPVSLDEVAPETPRNGGLPVYGYVDGDETCTLELRSAEPAENALAEHSETYRRLDTAVLEKLVLEDALGMTEDDISHQRGLGYARDLEEVMRGLHSGEYEIAFLLRPTPVEQVRGVAEAGETMPPKSTYFYPKILTGLLFNPLDQRFLPEHVGHARGDLEVTIDLHVAIEHRLRGM